MRHTSCLRIHCSTCPCWILHTSCHYRIQMIRTSCHYRIQMIRTSFHCRIQMIRTSFHWGTEEPRAPTRAARRARAQGGGKGNSPILYPVCVFVVHQLLDVRHSRAPIERAKRRYASLGRLESFKREAGRESVRWSCALRCRRRGGRR